METRSRREPLVEAMCQVASSTASQTDGAVGDDESGSVTSIAGDDDHCAKMHGMTSVTGSFKAFWNDRISVRRGRGRAAKPKTDLLADLTAKALIVICAWNLNGVFVMLLNVGNVVSFLLLGGSLFLTS